jgi:hypothetical protein
MSEVIEIKKPIPNYTIYDCENKYRTIEIKGSMVEHDIRL